MKTLLTYITEKFKSNKDFSNNYYFVIAYHEAYDKLYDETNDGKKYDTYILTSDDDPDGSFCLPKEIALKYKEEFKENIKLYEIPSEYNSFKDFYNDYEDINIDNLKEVE